MERNKQKRTHQVLARKLPGAQRKGEGNTTPTMGKEKYHNLTKNRFTILCIRGNWIATNSFWQMECNTRNKNKWSDCSATLRKTIAAPHVEPFTAPSIKTQFVLRWSLLMGLPDTSQACLPVKNRKKRNPNNLPGPHTTYGGIIILCMDSNWQTQTLEHIFGFSWTDTLFCATFSIYGSSLWISNPCNLHAQCCIIVQVLMRCTSILTLSWTMGRCSTGTYEFDLVLGVGHEFCPHQNPNPGNTCFLYREESSEMWKCCDTY